MLSRKWPGIVQACICIKAEKRTFQFSQRPFLSSIGLILRLQAVELHINCISFESTSHVHLEYAMIFLALPT